jgi:23S rRNA U2552 (ribose-2'-O)-methylase RlmE/FtsJ
MRERKSKNKLKILKYFFEAKNNSIKHYKYFEIYKNLFSKYVDKKIVFVEIGILNGGSLQLWKKFLGKKAKIIGIDINPDCRKFEEKRIQIFIGDQSDSNFWRDFFKKIGKVDVILDDGGHTNKQQIITTISCVKNIKDDGMLVHEDTHTSYIKEFANPSKYSFIEFVKKLIDDVNLNFSNFNKFNFSLNKYIWSIQTFESIVCLHINRKRCLKNKSVTNNGTLSGIQDMRYNLKNVNYSNTKLSFLKKVYFFKKIVNFVRLKIKIIKNKLSTQEIKIYFK